MPRRRNNFGLDAPLPTVAQALSSADRVDHLSARLDEMIAAQRSSALLEGEDYGAQLEGPLPPMSSHVHFRPLEEVEAEFAEATGFEAPSARPGKHGGQQLHSSQGQGRESHAQRDGGGGSFFLTEVDDVGGPTIGESTAALEEAFNQGPRQRRGPPVDPVAAYTALRMALDHPLSAPLLAKDGKPPHFRRTTAAMQAHMRSAAPLQPALEPVKAWPAAPQHEKVELPSPKPPALSYRSRACGAARSSLERSCTTGR